MSAFLTSILYGALVAGLFIIGAALLLVTAMGGVAFFGFWTVAVLLFWISEEVAFMVAILVICFLLVVAREYSREWLWRRHAHSLPLDRLKQTITALDAQRPPRSNWQSGDDDGYDPDYDGEPPPPSALDQKIMVYTAILNERSPKVSQEHTRVFKPTLI